MSSMAKKRFIVLDGLRGIAAISVSLRRLRAGQPMLQGNRTVPSKSQPSSPCAVTCSHRSVP
jgi:hypothetical protein